MALPADPALAPSGWLAPALRGVFVALILVAAVVLLRRTAPALLHLPAGPRGILVLVAGGALLTAAGVPRQAVAFAGGFAFGPFLGGGLALTAQLLGCALDYAVAAGFARGATTRRIAARWPGWQARLRAHPFHATLMLRLLPIGNNTLLSLAAGAVALRPVPFVAGSALGYLPQTAVFALLGAGVQVQRGTQFGIAAALFAASLLLELGLMRRMRDA